MDVQSAERPIHESDHNAAQDPNRGISKASLTQWIVDILPWWPHDNI